LFGRKSNIVKHITDVDQNIKKILGVHELFNEFSHITNISKNKMSDCKTNLITAVERWSEVFEFVQSEGISSRNIRIILGFSIAIAGTSASIERVFPVTNALWTDERDSVLVETIKAVIVTKTHFHDLSCNDFYIDFKETQITARNSFVSLVRNISQKGGTNYFNIRWKLIANEIL
jgi:hypothetical protein